MVMMRRIRVVMAMMMTITMSMSMMLVMIMMMIMTMMMIVMINAGMQAVPRPEEAAQEDGPRAVYSCCRHRHRPRDQHVPQFRSDDPLKGAFARLPFLMRSHATQKPQEGSPGPPFLLNLTRCNTTPRKSPSQATA